MVWKRFGWISSSIACGLVLWIMFFTNGFMKATVGTPLLVNVEVSELKDAQIAYAEIELPAGVSFFSKRFPELSGQRVLVMNWQIAVQNSHLPFVVQGGQAGKRVIVVTFYDSDRQVIARKEVKVRFENHG